MIRKSIPRIVIAGANSGCGKTTVTCGIMRALVKCGVCVSPFKCGPDYIDPMFHAAVTGTPGRNLDTFLFDQNTARYLLWKNAQSSDIAIIEGVMGFYDGVGAGGSIASTYDISHSVDASVILVVNGEGMSTSVLAIIKGFFDFVKNSGIIGVILNNVSRHIYEMLKPRIEDELGVKTLGYLPKLPENITFKNRYLGLVTPAELEDIQTNFDTLAAIVAENIDLDALFNLASRSQILTCEKPAVKRFSEHIKIAVARDKAFCFYYEDSLDLLCEMGAELKFFSPIKEKSLPEGVSGLILGGGYPELYLKELSSNKALLDDIREKLASGIPCIAECGGFMYLNRSIENVEMVGFLGSDCYKKDKLSRFGYVTLTATKDNLLCKAGESIAAHEYHYFDCNAPGAAFTAQKLTGREWKCVVSSNTLYAGFPHIHFYGNIKFAESFYEKCILNRVQNLLTGV